MKDHCTHRSIRNTLVRQISIWIIKNLNSSVSYIWNLRSVSIFYGKTHKNLISMINHIKDFQITAKMTAVSWNKQKPLISNLVRIIFIVIMRLLPVQSNRIQMKFNNCIVQHYRWEWITKNSFSAVWLFQYPNTQCPRMCSAYKCLSHTLNWNGRRIFIY